MKAFFVLYLFLIGAFFFCESVSSQNTIPKIEHYKCQSKPIKVCPDTVVYLSKYVHDTSTLNSMIRGLKQTPVETPTIAVEKYNTEIDRFLNIEDETIFINMYSEFDSVAIHPRSRKYYLLIKAIHNLSVYLSNVEQTISNENIEKVVREMKLPQETVKSLLLESVKKDIAQADKELENIIPLAKNIDFLSSEQKQYYKSLKEKFNNLYSTIYSIDNQ